MKVMFDYKQDDCVTGDQRLISGPVSLVVNKDLVQKYLDSMKHIPEIKKTFDLVPTSGLQVKDYV